MGRIPPAATPQKALNSGTGAADDNCGTTEKQARFLLLTFSFFAFSLHLPPRRETCQDACIDHMILTGMATIPRPQVCFSILIFLFLAGTLLKFRQLQPSLGLQSQFSEAAKKGQSHSCSPRTIVKTAKVIRTVTTTTTATLTPSIGAAKAAAPSSPPPLLRQSSSSSSIGFPHKLWQTSPNNANVGSEPNVQQWLAFNPSHRYERITAANGDDYVREHYAHDPNIVKTFTELQDGVLRADLVRYLLLLAEGGVYTDMDTTCLQPISSWVPAEYANRTDLVLGIEGDSLGGDLIPGFTYHVQFVMWTMMVKPGHFILKMIVDRVVAQLHALAQKQNTTIAGIQASYMDVMDTTGPGIFSQSIYQGLSQVSGQVVEPSSLTGMKEPRLFGNVLVLPVTSFGAGIGHSGAGEVTDPAALVHHMFAGTWKGDHPMGR